MIPQSRILLFSLPFLIWSLTGSLHILQASPPPLSAPPDSHTTHPPAIGSPIPQRDPEEAAEQYQKGKEALGGPGRPADPAVAARHLRSAAELGHSKAMGEWAWMLYNGLGTIPDPTAAFRWWHKAAILGDPKSKLNAGILLIRGKGTLTDPGTGLDLIRSAAEDGESEAMIRLAEMRHFGEPGVPPDPEEAALWARRAAETGHAQAQNLLGSLYEQGCGVPRRASVAVEWYRMAALQNHPKAQANLGRLLSGNRAGTPQRIEAWYWLRRSALQGEPLALNFLPEFRPALTQAELNAAEQRLAEWTKRAIPLATGALPVAPRARPAPPPEEDN